MYGIDILFINGTTMVVPVGTEDDTKHLLHRLSMCKINELCRLSSDILINLSQIMAIKIVEGHALEEGGLN